MLSMLKRKVGPIGLDMGHNTIRMIQLSQCDDGFEVVAAEEETVGGVIAGEDSNRHDFMVGVISDMISRGSFEGKDVVSCLSNNDLIVKSFRMAVSDEKEFDSLVRQEASLRFNLDPDKDEIRYVVAGRIMQGEEQKEEIILFAVKRSTIREHISVLTDSGLNPVGIDSVPFALLRSGQRSIRRESERQITRFYVDVGQEYTTVMVGKDEGVSFVKQIPIAGRHLNESVASKLDVTLSEAGILRSKLQNEDDDKINNSTRRALIDSMRKVNEQLVQEISKCFRYHAVTFRGKSPKEIILAGGVSYESTLVSALRRQLGVEVIQSMPLIGCELGCSDLKNRSGDHLSEWTVAAGACIKNWNNSSDGALDNERD